MSTYERAKKISTEAVIPPNPNPNGETDGYVLDANLHANPDELKTAADGRTALIPQPANSPHDPLNWSSRKKHTILFVVAYIACLPDYGSSQGISAILPQAEQWKLPEDTVQHNLVGNLFCLGAGGLVFVALSAYFGRLPVLLYAHLAALGTGVWCAAATGFESYLAARICNGFFSITTNAGGLMYIKDIFFFHEHPRKINIWSAGVIVSPYIGPMVASFLIWHAEWPWCFWVYTIFNVIGLALIVFFMDETFYNRRIPPEKQPLPRSRLLRLLGYEQWKNRHVRSSFGQAAARPFIAFSRVPVAILVTYYFLNFAWVIGVNSTVSIWLTTIYHFDPRDLGCFFTSGIIGALLGWLIGHWLHDSIARLYAARHGGRIEPEARLFVTYPASALMAVSVILIGLTLQHEWYYMALAVLYALQVVGIMVATVGVDAYLLDAYPEGSGEVGAWVNVGRTLGGFMATYVQIGWVTDSGAATALGVQGAIVGAAAGLVVLLQVAGKRIRRAQGPMRFATD